MVDMPNRKLMISVALVGALAVLITVFSVYHTNHLGSAYYQFPLFLYGATLLALGVGGFVVYLFEDKINRLQLDKILSILPPKERKIMKIIIERKEIEQKRLVTLAGMNAVQVSRILNIFEERGVIERKRQGYTNLIISRL